MIEKERVERRPLCRSVRKELEVKEIDEVKELQEWRAVSRTGGPGDDVVDQSRLMLPLITLLVKY